jgi:hypothetical protein
MKFRSLLIMAFALCLPFALAQDKAQSKPEKSEKKDAAATQKKTAKEAAAGPHDSHEMPKPTAEMQKLMSTFRGTWSTAEKHESSPMMPAGNSKGTATFRSGPGGFSLVEDYKEIGGMGFQGLGIFAWDPQKQAYTGYWCDSMSPNGCADSGAGKWQGADLVYEGEADMGGQKVKMKSVYTDIKPD